MVNPSSLQYIPHTIGHGTIVHSSDQTSVDLQAALLYSELSDLRRCARVAEVETADVLALAEQAASMLKDEAVAADDAIAAEAQVCMYMHICIYAYIDTRNGI